MWKKQKFSHKEKKIREINLHFESLEKRRFHGILAKTLRQNFFFHFPHCVIKNVFLASFINLRLDGYSRYYIKDLLNTATDFYWKRSTAFSILICTTFLAKRWNIFDIQKLNHWEMIFLQYKIDSMETCLTKKAFSKLNKKSGSSNL